ncbi:response regulator transcription factor [Bythopirellula goksoeyrii]|uniref:Transcriptional regulatory protein FixJ n=1 Tax=Bythopirellula goksoeyrii TaxID=1400387 RepID=A0A5B9QM21_9BACT|nr:response regulator [Bythopirellula goksoeyrii]QEG35043.1 Transcriptional regulatory protein FixJ [Bythopirellula goksoeyrii]
MNGTSAIEQAIVYIVDDDEQVRKGLVALVQAMGVASEAYPSAEDFLQAFEGRRPACLVTDVRMLGMSGLELQERLLQLGVSMSVIVLTAFATTPTTVRAMRNGALTLMEKPSNDEELWNAIRAGLASDLQNYQLELQRSSLKQRLDNLTPKELEVLHLMIAGDANKVIARKLDCSIRTIENHRQKVFHKMEADSLAELVRMAVALGIVPNLV